MDQHTSHPTLDDILGPASGRFFGSGYTTVVATLGPLVQSESADGVTATGIARVDFEGLWSRKGDRTLDPHVSTIDVIALAAQAAEQLTGAGTEPHHEWTISQVDIRAGAKPIESGFDALPVTAHLARGDGGATLTFSVASFTVRVEFTREKVLRHGLPLLDASVYESVYRQRSPEVREVTLDASGERASARCQVPALAGAWAERGVDRERGGRLNLVDAFVVVLQLGQAMLYRHDEMTRADSDTLWMRSTRLRATGERAGTADVSTSLEKSRLVTTGPDTWRLATITGTVGELFRIECSVAHRVPASVRPGIRSGAPELAALAHRARVGTQQVRT